MRHQSSAVSVSRPYLYFHFPSLLLGAVYFGGGWEMRSIPFVSRPLEPDHLTLVVRKALEQQRLNAVSRFSRRKSKNAIV